MDYIYARVSTSKQETLNQVVTLKQRFPDAQVHQESGSGSRDDAVRKLRILSNLLGNLKKGDRLIVWAIDRMARKAAELQLLFDWFNKKGIIFVSHHEGIDLTHISGRMIAGIFASIAQGEAERNSARVKLGMSLAKKKGKQIGRKHGYSPHLNQIRAARLPRGTAKTDSVPGFLTTIVTHYKLGLSADSIAELLCDREDLYIAKTTVQKYINILIEDGKIEKREKLPPKPKRKKRRKRDPDKHPRMGDGKRVKRRLVTYW